MPSGRPAPKKSGLPSAEILDLCPVRLGDHADGEAVSLEPAADGGRSPGGVIDVGIPGDEDDVERAPASSGVIGRKLDMVHSEVSVYLQIGLGRWRPETADSGQPPDRGLKEKPGFSRA